MKDNKLIADFMGIRGEYNEDEKVVYLESDIDGRGVYAFSDMKYHTSWDWLMPVVDKIKRTDLSREMVMQGIDELITEIDNSFYFNMAITYNAVVKFIEEYNKVKRNELQSL